MNKLSLLLTTLFLINSVSANLQAQNKDITVTANGVSFTMKYVEGGSFYMGSDDDDDLEDEKPMHKVILDDFYMAETEVTQELWEAIMGFSITKHRNNIDSDLPMLGTGREYPAYYISWIDCQEFISRLNALTGKTFRLPTEAEWEYAARGGKKSKGYVYAGSNNLEEVAWYGPKSGGQTRPVKQLKPNELGLYDMMGNVAEWCNDWYDEYTPNKQINPVGPVDDSDYFDEKVIRGGSVAPDYVSDRTITVRDSDYIDERYGNLFGLFTDIYGMRLALSEKVKETK